MKTISIDFRKFPDPPDINSNFKLSDLQKSALESLPPEVDKLNLEVEKDGHHLVIINATSQYYNPQEHEFSKEIPMTYEEINDMLYHSSHWDIHEFITNKIK